MFEPKIRSMRIYTKKDCMPCRMTKKELTRLGIPFEEIDLDDRPDQIDQVRHLGFTSLPVVVTDTDTWAGFDPGKLRTLKETGG